MLKFAALCPSVYLFQVTVVSTTIKTVEAPPPSSNDIDVKHHVQTSAAAASSIKPKEAAQMPNLDSFAAKLKNFAVVLSEKAKSCPVVIGNVGEIESAVNVKKVRHTHTHKKHNVLMAIFWVDLC